MLVSSPNGRQWCVEFRGWPGLMHSASLVNKAAALSMANVPAVLQVVHRGVSTPPLVWRKFSYAQLSDDSYATRMKLRLGHRWVGEYKRSWANNPRRQCDCVCFLSVENTSLMLFAHNVPMQYGFSATMKPIREALLKGRIYTTKELQWYRVPAESRNARAIPKLFTTSPGFCTRKG